jgi:radical SAM superfamily enzyme YgiQ (UPF0313 family)
MRVMLISPPAPSAVKEVLGATGPPLGLAYLASIARSEGHDVIIVDSLAEGINLRELKGRMRSFYPDVIGITATTSMIPDAYEAARVAKEVNPDATVLIGGPHVTFLPEETLNECKYIDIVVRGEGELIFRELLRKKDLRDVRGITYRSSGVIKSNPAMPLIPNLDEIPIPAYDLLPMHLYRFGNLRFGTIITSRGCPFNCIFCSSSLQFGKRWRAHSKERVIEELRILHQDYGVREVEFLDDTFTLDRRRAREISREIVREGLDISWTASSRVNTFDLETGREMKRAGAHTIYFGIESGSQKILDLIGKGITVEQSISAVKSAKKAKLRALGSFIIGFPEETEDDIRRTIDFSKKVGVDLAQFTIATPYPGTKLWDIANKMNLLLTRDWRKYTTIDVVMKSFYLTERQIKRLLNWAYISFYLRPKMILIDLMRNKGFILRKAVPAALKFFLGGEGVKKLRKEISKL